MIQLSGVGPIGSTYDVLATGDFVSWTPIGTITMDTRGSFSMVDHSASSLPTRYYRLRGTLP